MKTPDEIKKGLEWCTNDAFQCSCNCPYFNPLSNGVDCASKLHSDALSLIQQLEAQNAELLEKMQQLQRERDALLHIAHDCDELFRECKHEKAIDDVSCEKADYFCHLCKADCKCNKCNRGSQFEWRGPCEENGGTE